MRLFPVKLRGFGEVLILLGGGVDLIVVVWKFSSIGVGATPRTGEVGDSGIA